MQPRLSVIAIMKNEQDNIHGFLGSVGLVADEIILVDTGSTDDTCKIAKGLGFKERGGSDLKLRYFKWKADFAAARNFALKHATGYWVLWMDLDDTLEKSAPAYINELKQHEDHKTGFGFLVASETEEPGAYVRFLQLRMFPRGYKIKWERPIHETLHASMDKAGLSLEPVKDCVIIHKGYKDPVLRANKAIRNAMILENLKEDSFERFYQLGDAYYAVGDYELGMINYSQAINKAKTDLQSRSATERVIFGHMLMSKFDSAQTLLNMLPDDVPEKVFWLAEFDLKHGNKSEAKAGYEKLLDMEYNPQSMNSYLDGYKARAEKVLAGMEKE